MIDVPEEWGLNDEQKEAVKHVDGPLLVLAGPGTGKTKTVTCRIAYLINVKKVKPWQILAITFTKKAADEMRERADALLGDDVDSRPKIGTFHSFCNYIIRRNIGLLDGYHNGYTICDASEQINIMGEVIEALDIPGKCPKKNYKKDDYAKDYIKKVSMAKNSLQGPKEYAGGTDGISGQVYNEYQKSLVARNMFDFDDLVMKTVELFEQHPDVLEKYQSTYKYIMVDEYQDTNHSQFRLIELLAKKHKNICVVGDDDQSIYRFRGADVSNILFFEDNYNEAKEVNLKNNYRSSREIINLANGFIVFNKDRKRKKIEKPGDHDENGGEMNPPHIKVFDDQDDELDGIIDVIRREAKTRSYSDIAVLTRSNRQLREFVEKFDDDNIPYVNIDGIGFYERAEIKDILAYFRVIVNSRDDSSLRRIINVPARGLGEASVEKINAYQRERFICFFDALEEAENVPGLDDNAIAGITSFLGIVNEIRTMSYAGKSLTDQFDKLMELTGYKDKIDKNSRLNIIAKLRKQLESFENDHYEDDNVLERFLAEVAFLENSDTIDQEEEGVRLMTMHKSKGLEFPCVIIPGLDQSRDDCQENRFGTEEEIQILEEERRILYVGITRAMKSLYLTYAKKRRDNYQNDRDREPSMFIQDICYWAGRGENLVIME